MKEEVVSEYSFARRHIGPSAADVVEMLKDLGHSSLNDFSDAVLPEQIRQSSPLDLSNFPKPIRRMKF